MRLHIDQGPLSGALGRLPANSKLAAGGGDALARSIDRWSRVLYVVAFAVVFFTAVWA